MTDIKTYQLPSLKTKKNEKKEKKTMTVMKELCSSGKESMIYCFPLALLPEADEW